MIVLMIIGGSPGGTAGGIRTAVLAILSATFWNSIRNRDNVLCSRSIDSVTVIKALTIAVSFLLMLSISIFLLIGTQTIKPTDLIYEAVSALATVGVSLGATSSLNEAGKAIVIITMFAGRVGPVILFMLLGGTTDKQANVTYPSIKISMT